MTTTFNVKEWMTAAKEYDELEVHIGEDHPMGVLSSIKRALIPGEIDRTQLVFISTAGEQDTLELIPDEQAIALLHLLQAYLNEERLNERGKQG